jgi:hypothetical protein
MALRQYNVTLGAGATQVTSTRRGIRHAIIQNTAGNAAIFIGDADVTNAIYGHTLAASGILHLGPFSGDAPLSTDELYITGTQSQVVHVLLITH